MRGAQASDGTAFGAVRYLASIVVATSLGERAMSTSDERHLARLAIEIEPELRARVEAAATERGLSVRDYVVAVLRLALERHGENGTSGQASEWSQLSVPAFARDWESDADAVYDDLA
jgi:hypothetical protein